MKLIIIKLKNIVIPFCICMFITFLIIFSTNNISAAKSGISLWAFYIVPSMFPFFIATELLSYTNVISLLGKILNKIMRPVFNVPGESAFALIMGIISGYPVGAKIVSNLKFSGICSDIECERLIAYTNNSGPLFIIGTVGISMFGSQKIGVLLFVSHILSCILVGFLFRFWKKNNNYNNKYNYSSNKTKNTLKKIDFYNVGELLSSSIKSSIESLLIIGGFVIFFSIAISMLKSSNILKLFSDFIEPFLKFFSIPDTFSNSIIIGLIEVTNGLKNICIPNNNLSIIIASFLLGLGGISIFMQVLSIISKAKISIWPYIIGKTLQACFSVIFICLLYLIF